MTYGDQVAAAALEVIMRELLAPKCKTKLGAKILTDHRFVDDVPFPTIKHHNVPLVETGVAVEGTELYTTTIINHPEILEQTFMKNLIFTVRHGIDSMCLLFSLRPGFVTKNVMVRNAALSLIHI